MPGRPRGNIRSPSRNALGCFRRSAAAGARIAEAAVRNIVPCILKLGGKSANIIFDDADLDRAIVGSQAAMPLDRSALMGRIKNFRQFEKVQTMVNRAAEQGGRIITGGNRPDAFPDGYF
ncbi:MAG: aldehyde dehydrogenase family protein [Paracoccus sp. (in: a-proteobacteria)]|nr:aldehyde dehydrogenase family protein [Paracoccus sp. (in: a-proteobacteria)]